MTAMFLFMFLSLSRIIYAVAEETRIHVTQIPEQAIILNGTNITFHCIIPLEYDSSGIEVRWRKQGENQYLQSEVDARKRLGTKNRGGGYFELLNATIHDSGIYHCVVVRQGTVSGEGTGSDLTVCAVPTPLKLFSGTPGNNSSSAPTLVCETAEFHPSELTLAWYKNGTAATTEISTIKQQNTEGLYKVSSSLRVTQSEVNGAVYACLVSHISLRTPAIVIHAVPKSYPEPNDCIWYLSRATAGIVFMVIMTAIAVCCKLKNRRKYKSVGGHEEVIIGDADKAEVSSM